MSIKITPSGKTGTQQDKIEKQENKLFDEIYTEKHETEFGTVSYKPQFDAETIPFDAEIEMARQQYCEASGKPLCKVDADTVNNLLTIHGRETTIKILLTQQKQISLEWIWLNNDGLDKLAMHDPAGYFVYAASKLLQDVTIHNELMRLHEAAMAWKNLQAIDDSILPPINELIRRLLAGYKRNKLNKYLAKFAKKKVNEITSELSNLTQFQIELTDLIQDLIAKKKKKEIYESGMTAFRMQSMITALSELEMAVGKEFNDFDIVDGKSSESIHAIVGTKYRHTKVDKRQKQYSQQTVKTKVTAGFKLKIGDNDNGKV